VENARISGWQLFVLITLFEIGSAFLVGLAMNAKQDAWIAILVGMISSYALIFMYYRLHRYYPHLALTEYIEKNYWKSAATHINFSLRIIFC
jgi:spore germination protein KB